MTKPNDDRSAGAGTKSLNRRAFAKYAVAGLGAMAAPSIAACGGSGSGGGVTLTLLLNGIQEQTNRLKHVLDDFKKTNKNITVNVQNIADGNAFYTKVNTQGVAKTLPDIWYVRTFDVAYDGIKGWSEPLNDYIDKDPHFGKADVWKALGEQIKFNDKAYTLPENISCLVVYVNKSIFKKAGAQLPSPDWTWADFADTAAKIPVKKNKGRQNLYGGDIGAIMGAWTLHGVLIGNGGGLYSADFKTATADRAENLKFLEYASDLRKRGLMPAPGGFPTGVDPFVAGLEAMTVGGDWSVATYPEAIADKFEWEILPIPKGSSGKRGISVAGGGFGVSAFSKHKAEAFKVANYITSTSALNYRIADVLYSPPARLSSMPTFLKTAKSTKYAPAVGLDYIVQSMNEAVPVAYPPYMIPLQTAVTNRLTPIFTGTPVEKQLGLLQQDMEKLIKDYYK